MGNFRRPTVAIAAILSVMIAANIDAEPSTINVSNSWLLPQNDFPVFYRHFKDRVTWFEADAVCQFHHAQLVTVESTNQFEVMSGYLKELDVIENVWIGLKRNNDASEFAWTNYQPLAKSGYFREDVPRSSEPVCVVSDPTANFKWHSLHCGGPEVASFVCELPVPSWASKNNGCMASTVESTVVTFLPEHPAIQLTKECSPGVFKNVTCKGNMKQSEIIERLNCPDSNKLLKTLFKSVKPNLADVKIKTTTSNAESDVEDYVEMVTIAQYNDETFQSISKVMGRGNGISFPQEMSIAQEPFKSRGRNGFDTNGIDSAFIAAGPVMAETVATTADAATTLTIAAATTTAAATTAAATTAAATTAAPTTAAATTAAATTAATTTAATTTAAAATTTAAATTIAATTAAPSSTERRETPSMTVGPTTGQPAATVRSAKTDKPTVANGNTTPTATETTSETADPSTAPTTILTAATTSTATATAAAIGRPSQAQATVTIARDPVRVYKKIDLPPLYDVVDLPYKPTTVVTTTAPLTAAAAASKSDTTANTIAEPGKTAETARTSPTAVNATVVNATAVNATAVNATAATAVSAVTAAAGDPVTTADVTTAAAAANNRRKSVSYESYVDHPSRSRHLVRPKQQHHSYPYILYRLLG